MQTESIVEKTARELPVFIAEMSQTDGYTAECEQDIRLDAERYVNAVTELHAKVTTIKGLSEPSRSKADLLLRKELGRQWDFLKLKTDRPRSIEEVTIKNFIEGKTEYGVTPLA